jgi:diguanylate cyclase (GGDEF)-like protein
MISVHATAGATLDLTALSSLMPLHVLLGADGTILSVGPTVQRMRPNQSFRGTSLFHWFHIRRPHGVGSMEALLDGGRSRLSLEFQAPPRTALKGHFVPTADGRYLLDLSFGITVSEAVATYGLTAADFAPTTLAVELLYLVEAKSAAMSESRNLNRRLEDARIAAERLARTDALTGLLNRRGMETMIEDMMERGASFGLMHVDLDYFKSINDTFGHAAGDQVLMRVARLLERETRDVDSVIRLGGDEFVILMREMTNGRRLAAVADRIIAALSQPIPYEGNYCRVSASIGITTSDIYDCPDVNQMLRDADLALYRSKLEGRSRMTVFGAETPTLPTEAAEPAPLRAAGGKGSRTP